MYHRNRVFAASCLGMLLFGIVMTTLGAILPSIIEEFGVDKSRAGSLFLLMSFGILVGSVVFGPVVDRYGFKNLLVLCTVLVLAGLEGIAFAPEFELLSLAVFVVGFGGGVINGGTNALVADISEEERSARLSLLGVFFGVGAFGVPFTLGFLLNVFSYSTLIACVGAVVLFPLLFFLIIRFPAPKQTRSFPLRKGLDLLKDPVLLLMGSMLFLQSGMEITAGGWTATYFNEVLGLNVNIAVFFLSLFWVGMVVARLLLGSVLKRASPGRVLKVFIGVAFVGSVMLVVSRSLFLAAPGIFLLGAGLAAGYPIVLGYVGDRYPRLSGTAFSIVLVMGLVGGSLWPYLAGIVGEAFGLRSSFVIIPVSLVLMVLLLAAVLHRLPATRAQAISSD